jgi:hypothetical protein
MERQTGNPRRPTVSPEVRHLIRQISLANPRWGAPRLHGELLKIGIEVCQATVAKYMVRHRNPPSQTWRTFLENHSKQLVAIDFFTVPTIRFQVLYVFLVFGPGCLWRIDTVAVKRSDPRNALRLRTQIPNYFIGSLWRR